jgi:hypothetical protein
MSLLAQQLARTLVDRATVYAEHPTTGDYTVTVASAVPCRLEPLVGVRDAPRAELADQQRLLLDAAAGAALTEHHQVEIAGKRWNVVPGSVQDGRDLPGGVLVRMCLVEEAA